MILPQQQKKEIIDGLLFLLLPAEEMGTELMTISGNTLISNDVKTDVKGNQIVGGKKYIYPVEKVLPVNHAAKISELIELAGNLEEMQERLAAYLSKYGDKSKL